MLFNVKSMVEQARTHALNRKKKSTLTCYSVTMLMAVF